MSNHDSTMTTPVWKILEQLATCPILIERGEAVAGLSRDPAYVGRHRITEREPLIARAAHRIVEEWTKPRDWTTAIGQRIANSLSDDQAEKVYDLVTGETFREAARTLSTTWRAMDRAAYGRIPKTWRHRLETRARNRALAAEQRHNTELWWAGRQSDYAPALGLHTPTQPLHIIREKTNA